MNIKRVVLVHAISEHGMSVKHVSGYIKWMMALGFKFVSLEQMALRETKGKLVSLAVDDAYKCVKTNLMPVLLRHHIPCTLFVPPGLLGLKANDSQLMAHACYENEDMMTIEDLREWSENGFEVGFHTNMHIDLSVTDIAAQTDDFMKGVSKLKELGYKPDKFAYPFGRLPKDYVKFQDLLSAHGFKYAYTLWPGNVDSSSPLLINRICLGDHTPVWWNILKTIGLLDKRLRKKCELVQRPCRFEE